MSSLPHVESNHNESVLQTLQELKNLKFALDESAIVAITDVHGVITYVNDTFCDISQYSREELTGKTHRIINSGYHPKAFFTHMWETISQGHVWKGEVKNRAKDGSFYWVDTTITPFIDQETGKPTQYIAIRKDITYLKRVEKELRLLNEGLEERIQERTAALERLNQELSETLVRLQESDRTRETFVAALTHDLRTPLIAEQRVLELLQAEQGKLPEKLKTIGDRLNKNNADLLELVNKLLEIYQYEAGNVGLLIGKIDLVAQIEDCIHSLLPIAQKREITIQNNPSPDIPMLEADPVQIRRVFSNLIHNAIQHINPKDSILISANYFNNKAYITIKDTGPGIPSEMLGNLFDRYYVSRQSRKKIGSGLGLSICKMIVKLHHGTIDVESEEGKGTTFTIMLPITQESKE